MSDPPKGSIVPVTQTNVDIPVYAANGAQVQNLAIAAASGANRPGSGGSLTVASSGSGASSTGSPSSSPSSSSSSEGFAAKPTHYGPVEVFAAAAAVFGAGFML